MTTTTFTIYGVVFRAGNHVRPVQRLSSAHCRPRKGDAARESLDLRRNILTTGKCVYKNLICHGVLLDGCWVVALLAQLLSVVQNWRTFISVRKCLIISALLTMNYLIQKVIRS